MANIELYIEKQLCDLESPDKLAIYLKRQLLNPSELSTKDAQRSYDITLPATDINNAIFGHTNVEEVKGKFAQLYDAVLLVDGVKIMDGKFKIKEITSHYYKGNLGIPAQKNIKDIFGEMKMNEAGEWRVPFKSFEWMTSYNKEDQNLIAKVGTPLPCFFPLVAYKLFDKKNSSENDYTPKDVIDNTLRCSQDNFPPSINCLQAIKKIFENQGIKKITGSAFSDDLLTNLYMSYRNPVDYEMPWNYAKMGRIRLNGTWANYKEGKGTVNVFIYPPEENKMRFYIGVLNFANTSDIKILESGTNLTKTERDDGAKANKTTIEIPYSGLYKVKFKVNVHRGNNNGTITVPGRETRLPEGTIWAGGITREAVGANTNNYNFGNTRTEVKLICERRGEKLDNILTENQEWTNSFYTNNLNQSRDDEKYPHYFPEQGKAHYIDPAQDNNLVCGFAFGKKGRYKWVKPEFNIEKENYEKYVDNLYEDHIHPKDTSTPYPAYVMVKQGWESWLRDGEEYKRCNAVTDTRYEEASKNSIGEINWKESKKYTSIVENMPMENKAVCDQTEAEGTVSCIYRFERGDKLHMISMSDYLYDGTHEFVWPFEHIDFELELEPFMTKSSWIKINEKDNTFTGKMDWNDRADILSDEINLIKFMPKEIKVEDWISNFCKAFNLSLIQRGFKEFELNTNNRPPENTSNIIDLDAKTDVNHNRRNASLGIPSAYRVGFTVDKDEEGYVDSEEDGGGYYETGSPENKVLSQTSNFSYNWFKEFTIDKDDAVNIRKGEKLAIPIISDKEVWGKGTYKYKELSGKDYVNKAQRFWYKGRDNKLVQIPINEDPKDKNSKQTVVKLGTVTDHYVNGDRSMRLDYRDRTKNTDDLNSILDNYFILMSNPDNQYTTVECFLTPEEYNRINESLVRLNGDLYSIAEVDGYDPLGYKKCTLKIIRKIL